MTDSIPEKIAPGPLTKSQRRTLRRNLEKESPFAEPPLPEGPYLTADGDLTDAGEQLIHVSVMAGNTQDLVGKQLGLKPLDFAKRIKREGSAFYNAWRIANAELDSAYLRSQTYRGIVLRSPDAIAFGLRQRGYSEKTAPTTTVNVEVGPKIAMVPPGTSREDFEAFTEFMREQGRSAMPGSHDRTAYMASVGQTPGEIAAPPDDVARLAYKPQVAAERLPTLGDAVDGDGNAVE